jgi:hypothetical protein
MTIQFWQLGLFLLAFGLWTIACIKIGARLEYHKQLSLPPAPITPLVADIMADFNKWKQGIGSGKPQTDVAPDMMPNPERDPNDVGV